MCTAGDGSDASVQVRSNFKHKRVAAGKTVRYRVQLRNVDKTKVASGLVLSTRLPAQLISSKNSRGYKALPSRSKAPDKARFHHVDLEHPTFNATDNILTWGGLLIPPRKRLTFGVKVWVDRNAASGTALTFSSTVYQVRGNPLSLRGARLPFKRIRLTGWLAD